ncbi:MAG: hypothetical protein KGV51_03445 [Moraxellaceae bacterium]|nr:hypothetical protein [Moraxellaceae bacterium]
MNTQDKVFQQDVETSQALAVTMDKITLEQLHLSEQIGALKAFDFTKKLLTVSTIKMLAEIKETKKYKGLQIIGQNGKLLTVSNWEEFCNSLGVSRQKVDLDIQNLSAFGEDFLETSQRMGVGYRDLRKLRKLSDEDREIIINGEALKSEDKDSLLDLIEEMSAKNAKEKAELKKQVKDLQAESKANESIIKSKTNKIVELSKAVEIQLDAPVHERAKPYLEKLGVLGVQFNKLIGDYKSLYDQIEQDEEVHALIRVNMGHALLEISSNANDMMDYYGLHDTENKGVDTTWLDDADFQPFQLEQEQE